MLSEPVDPRMAPPDPSIQPGAQAFAGVRARQGTSVRVQRLGAGNPQHLSPVSPLPARRSEMNGQRRMFTNANYSISYSLPDVAGINPWWTFEERDLPGGGSEKVNIANGNGIMQYDDLAYTAQGIGLDFRRTFNSTTEQQEAAGSLPPSQYGNGWTNTFDAHLLGGTDSSGRYMISVFDIDGARYDYTCTSPCSGYWNPPAGEHAALTSDGGIGYFWTKKSGTVYYFYSPQLAQMVPDYAALSGKIYAIYSRNYHSYLSFTYTFDNGDETNLANLRTIMVNHSNRPSTTCTQVGYSCALLTFGDVSGRRILTSLRWPDGNQVSYSYDTGDFLIRVDHPGYANSGQTVIQVYNHGVLEGENNPNYPDGAQYYDVESPRLSVQQIYNTSLSDGSYDALILGNAFTGYSGVSRLEQYANVNPNFGANQPDEPTQPYLDGYSNGLLQPTMPQRFPSTNNWGENLSLINTNGSTGSQLQDSDGHLTQWYWDAIGRVTERIETNDTAPTSEAASYSWTTTNDLASESDFRTDPNGQPNATNYLYDPNGNTTAVAQPYATDPTSGLLYRPTAWYTYDSSNNVIAYCDPVYVHSHGGDWNPQSNPQTTPSCPQSPSQSANEATQFFYSYLACPTGDTPAQCATMSNAYEPNGELQMIETPLGYKSRFTYDPASQSNIDYGLPSEVKGDSYQQYDGSSNAKDLKFTYDQLGNVLTVNSGNGTTTFSNFDYMNRPQQAQDPDGKISYKTYNQNGSVAQTESAGQAAIGTAAAVSFVYDLDGNLVSETHHHGCTSSSCTAGITSKYYDGADRLIEVKMPWNPSDFSSGNDVYPFPWMTRYIYDLTQNGSSSIATVPAPGSTKSPQTYSFLGHGNLVKTQEYLPAPYPAYPVAAGATGSWMDQKATGFDRQDRPTYTINAEDGVQITNTYDGPSQYGLLSKSCDIMSNCDSYAYDYVGRKIQDGFSAGPGQTAEANRIYAFDPDGRESAQCIVLVNSSQCDPANSFGYSFDADGRQTVIAEPSITFGSTTDYPSLSYGYYPDGKRASVTAATPYQGSTIIQNYAYRADGARTSYKFSYNGAGANESSTMLSTTYDAAGKPQTRVENTPGSQSFSSNWGYDSTTGRLASYTFPGGNINYTYDYEDQPYTETLTPLVGSGETDTRSVNVRNELLKSSLSPLTTMASANGFMLNTVLPSPKLLNGHPDAQGDKVPAKVASGQIDAILGRIISAATAWAPSTGCSTECYQSSYGATYDTLGNMLTSTSGYTDNKGNFPSIGVVYRQFDFEHHTLSTNGSFPGTYQWGPNGRLLRIKSVSSSTGQDELHWDDDQLLYTTVLNSGNQSDPPSFTDDIKLESFGDWAPPQTSPGPTITFLDRDISGTVVGCHNADTTHSITTEVAEFMDSWDPTGARNTSMCGGGAEAPHVPNYTWISPLNKRPYGPAVGIGGVLSAGKSDGFNDGLNTFQGIRTFDSSTSTWTTPDAYAGDVRDPRSQKGYLWNNANPSSYSDPTGYCSDPGGSGVRICIDAFIQQSKVMLTYAGDNRGFNGSENPDTYRARVNVYFSNHSVGFHVGSSHDTSGKKFDGSSSSGSYATWLNDQGNSNEVLIHLQATAGGPLANVAPYVQANLQITLNKDGSVSVLGDLTTFPSFEIYAYDANGKATLVYQHVEWPMNQAGPFFLIPGRLDGVDVNNATEAIGRL